MEDSSAAAAPRRNKKKPRKNAGTVAFKENLKGHYQNKRKMQNIVEKKMKTYDSESEDDPEKTHRKREDKQKKKLKSSFADAFRAI